MANAQLCGLGVFVTDINFPIVLVQCRHPAWRKAGTRPLVTSGYPVTIGQSFPGRPAGAQSLSLHHHTFPLPPRSSRPARHVPPEAPTLPSAPGASSGMPHQRPFLVCMKPGVTMWHQHLSPPGPRNNFPFTRNTCILSLKMIWRLDTCQGFQCQNDLMYEVVLPVGWKTPPPALLYGDRVFCKQPSRSQKLKLGTQILTHSSLKGKI